MGRLLDAGDCVLTVIDAQDGFLRKLPEAEAAQLVDRIAWLCRLAGRLEVPVVVTEEAPDRNGATAPPIRESLAEGTARYEKPVFDLSACREILEEIDRHGRGTVVLCGLETDVCVAQSALGLLDRGQRVAVVEDAVASPGTAHAQGLARMAGAGIELVGLKGLAYEWVRTVAGSQELGDPPAGIVL